MKNFNGHNLYIDIKNLKILLKKKTSCTVQHDGWTCGTCFFAISKELKNRDWQTVLYLRGDYERKDLQNLPDEKYIYRRLKRIFRILQK